MGKLSIVGSFLALLLALVVTLPDTGAHERYSSGCNDCHGAFTDGTSTKGSVFPGGDKHYMHRSSQAMNAECDLCHSGGDGNDPFIGSSDGTSNNAGLGCNGCHNAEGLRAHHVENGVSCAPCHSGDPTPPAESVIPPYYGTADSNVDQPCNTVASANVGENWTIGDFIGSDNDGDGLYDGNDPDCGTPGEVSALLISGHDRSTQTMTIDYSPGCVTSDNNFYFGSLAQVSTLSYSGQDCGISNTGSFVWNYSVSPDSIFFLVVGNDTTVEGSYGKNSGGSERSEAAACAENQDLALACDQAK